MFGYGYTLSPLQVHLNKMQDAQKELSKSIYYRQKKWNSWQAAATKYRKGEGTAEDMEAKKAIWKEWDDRVMGAQALIKTLEEEEYILRQQAQQAAEIQGRVAEEAQAQAAAVAQAREAAAKHAAMEQAAIAQAAMVQAQAEAAAAQAEAEQTVHRATDSTARTLSNVEAIRLGLVQQRNQAQLSMMYTSCRLLKPQEKAELLQALLPKLQQVEAMAVGQLPSDTPLPRLYSTCGVGPGKLIIDTTDDQFLSSLRSSITDLQQKQAIPQQTVVRLPQSKRPNYLLWGVGALVAYNLLLKPKKTRAAPVESTDAE